MVQSIGFTNFRKTWDYILDEFLLQVPFMQDPEYEYQSSTFFEDQLNALDVWLDFGSRTTPPQQLPIILKVCIVCLLILDFTK